MITPFHGSDIEFYRSGSGNRWVNSGGSDEKVQEMRGCDIEGKTCANYTAGRVDVDGRRG